MPTINDANLRQIYSELETSFEQDPDIIIDDWVANFILAAVADKSHKSSDQAFEEITSGGLDAAGIVKLAKDGMGRTEKADILRILDQGQVPLSERARNLLEAVVGRATLDAGAVDLMVDGLEIIKSHKGGIKGWTMPNAVVEAINLSTAPKARLFLTDTVEIGKADADGIFLGKYVGQLKGSKEGDVVRLRARTEDGQVSNWLTVRLEGLGRRDTSNAAMSVYRVHLTPGPGDRIEVSNLSSRPISEPGAEIRIVNERTGHRKTITLDGNGTFPDGAQIRGENGDTFTIAVSDGVNNKDFAELSGRLFCGRVDADRAGPQIDDPMLHPDEVDKKSGEPKFAIRHFDGRLFVRGVRAKDVAQGYLANCFFPAAVGAIAHTRPDAIKNMVRKNDDGTFTVTFKKWIWQRGSYKDVEIKVDGDLWCRSNGEPLYGTSHNTPKTADAMEMWYPIVEKAHAIWKNGTYKKMGNGGHACDVFENILGMWPEYEEITKQKPNAVWKIIKRACDDDVPMSAATYGEKKEALYTNTGVHSDHCYTVLGYGETRTGKRFVKLRNPWGEGEPARNGHDDGVFKMPLDTFCRLYESLHWCSEPG